MSQVFRPKIKLIAAMAIAAELEKELESKEALLKETRSSLRAIQDQITLLTDRVEESLKDEEMVITNVQVFVELVS